MKFKFSHKVSNEANLSPKPADPEETETKATKIEDNNSSTASNIEETSDSSSLSWEEVQSSSTVSSNSSSTDTSKKLRPRPIRPSPEERLAALVSKHPSVWSCKDVGDWLDCLAFGKYRKAFTHHAVTGLLLPKLTDSTLKEELGVASLGHRELMLRSITNLFECWAKEGGEAGTEAAGQHATSPLSLGTPKASGQLQFQSPVISIPGAEIVKAEERRVRLAHDLDKATTRAAQKRAAAEQAQRNADLAGKEVERLHVALKEAKIEAHGGKFAMAVKGGKNLASPKKKESHGLDETKFMDRLQADIEAREKKAKIAAKLKSGKQMKGGAAVAGDSSAACAGSVTAADGFKSSLQFLQGICAEKDPSFVEFLELPADNDEEGRTKLAAKLDDLVGRLAGELGIAEQDVEFVKHAEGAQRKAQRLTSVVKKAIFMQRLDQDLSARDQRSKELKQHMKAERAALAKAAEEKDLREAREAFAELGWPADAMQSNGTTGDDLLGALLKRARAVQLARAAGKAVDWDLHREDGLIALISQVANNSTTATPATAPLPSTDAAGTPELSTLSSMTTAVTNASISAAGPPVLQETVTLLSHCRGDELDRLDALKGIKKILSTYRALRAQEFLRTTRDKLEAKVAKAAEFEESQRPTRKVLPKEAAEAFLQRLSEDAARRTKNREELQSKAREEEKKKAIPVGIKGKGTPAAAKK